MAHDERRELIDQVQRKVRRDHLPVDRERPLRIMDEIAAVSTDTPVRQFSNLDHDRILYEELQQ